MRRRVDIRWMEFHDGELEVLLIGLVGQVWPSAEHGDVAKRLELGIRDTIDSRRAEEDRR